MNHYDQDAMKALYRLAWGPSIHFGLYPTGYETIEDAVLHAKKAMAEAGGITSLDHVLEVGCGEGETARWLAREIGCRVTATNYARTQLESAETKTTAEGLDHHIRHEWADYQNLPYEGEVFDVHWCQESFVHCEDKTRYFAEAFRVLRRGGRLVLSEQTTRRDCCTEEELRILTQRHNSPDLWDAGDMAQAASAAGFAEATVQDWSPHMRRHFRNLVERIEANLDLFMQQVEADTLFPNLELWKSAVAATESGKIGWHLLTARKPD